LKCDHETTTPVDIDSGVLNVVVDFVPRKPAEFVIMRSSGLSANSPCERTHGFMLLLQEL
jgi:hypothetical protein